MRNRILCSAILALFVCCTATSCGGSAAEPLTLDEFMGWNDLDEQAAQKAWDETDRRIQESTADCMAAHGLEYTIDTVDAIPDFWVARQQQVWDEGLTENEEKLRFGYFAVLMLEEYRYNVEHSDQIAQSNPNEAIHSQQAPEGVDYMGIWQECDQQAVDEVRGAPDDSLHIALEEAWRPLESAFDKMGQDLETDPRLADAQATWSACMTEAGHDFRTEEDIEAYLWPKLKALIGDVAADPEGGASLPGNATEADLELLAAEELAIAAADVGCRAELDRVREEVRAEYHGDFIAEHRDQLEEIRELEQQLMQRRLEGKD